VNVLALAAIAPMRLVVLCSTALLASFSAVISRAETIGGNPGPQYNYVCPHADGKPALECFLDAVSHLYTMCRNVKSIEILEFGYEKSTEGTNGAKSESCLDKQKQNIARPYQAALKDAKKSKTITEQLQRLHEAWLSALTQLIWKSGESDEEYKARVAKPYEAFNEHIAGIRTVVASDAETAAHAKSAKAEKSKPDSKTSKQQAKAKTH
jgi:hypothetical protein